MLGAFARENLEPVLSNKFQDRIYYEKFALDPFWKTHTRLQERHYQLVDNRVYGQIRSRPRRELTAEALRRHGVKPKHEIRSSKAAPRTETISNVQKNKKSKTKSIRIRGFGFSSVLGLFDCVCFGIRYSNFGFWFGGVSAVNRNWDISPRRR